MLRATTGQRPRLLDDLRQSARHALCAVEDRELADVLERRSRRANDVRQGLGDLLGDDGFLVLAESRGTTLDAGSLGLGAGPDGFRLGEAARLDGVALGHAGDPCGVGLGFRLKLDGRRLGLGRQADFLGGCFGLADARVAIGRRESCLAVRLGVGGLADVYLELLLLLLRLQLGDARLLFDDSLVGLRFGQRALLCGLLLGAIDLGLEAGLLDLGVADRLGDLGLSRLLLRDGGLVRLGTGNAGVLLDLGLVRHRQVLDICRGAGDGLDLEAVDDEPEGLHLDGAPLPDLLGELVLVADHLLDCHRSGDGPEMADEDVHDLGLELLRRAVQEAASGIGDRAVVVADLVDDHAAQVQADLLLADAWHGDFALVGHEREGSDLDQARHHESASACNDPEAHTFHVATTHGGDDQGLVRFRDPPRGSEPDDQEDQQDEDDEPHHCQRRLEVTHRGSLTVSVGSTSTVRPPRLPTTRTWACFLIVASGSDAAARNRSVPCRTSTSTSPRWPGVMSAVTRPILPMMSYDTPALRTLRGNAQPW